MILTTVVYWCHQVGLYAMTFFLPAIIAAGFTSISTLQVGLLSAIPWIACTIGAVIGPKNATTPGRSHAMVMYGLVGMAVGFSVVGITSNVWSGILGFTIAAALFYVVQPPLLALPATRLTGSALAGAIALVNTVGITGGFVGPYFMGWAEDMTGSPKAGIWLGVVLCVIGAVLARWLNFDTGVFDLSKTREEEHPAIANPA